MYASEAAVQAGLAEVRDGLLIVAHHSWQYASAAASGRKDVPHEIEILCPLTLLGFMGPKSRSRHFWSTLNGQRIPIEPLR
jgi:hypothetical protein